MTKKITDLLYFLYVYIISVLSAAFLWNYPLFLMFIYLVISVFLLIKQFNKRNLFYFLTGFIFGPLGEILAIYFGAWQYAEPFYLIPIWLPFLWGIAVLSLIKITEVFSKEE